MKKRFIILGLICGTICVPLHAQSRNSSSPFGALQASVMSVNAGPIALAGAALNAGEITSGMKTSPGFAYAPGALIDFTYSRAVGFDLGITYDSRTINFHDAANSSSEIDYTLGYISLRPELRFDGFLIGVGLGLPISVTTTSAGGATAPAVHVADANALFEGRIGSMVEIMSSDAGTLDFIIEGSYAFSRNLTNTWFHGTDETRNNGPIATAELGVCYLFDVYRAMPVAQPLVAAKTSSYSSQKK